VTVEETSSVGISLMQRGRTGPRSVLEESRSVILVFHGKAFSDVDELADTADSDYLQTVPGGRIGFSRGLAVATPAVIRRAPVADDPKPRRIDHDGIDDAFEGKGSMIFYWTGEEWIRLQGSD
jgi:hypothetical protein